MSEGGRDGREEGMGGGGREGVTYFGITNDNF